jgi:gamma-glutamylcyclotransferase (GGCT)/AIG2-like uncharacterized protein YtfP
VGRARLTDWSFLINVRGVATISHEPGDTVWGFVWLLEDRHVRTLDRYEGTGEGRYERRWVQVRRPSRSLWALTYVDRRQSIGEARPGYMDRVLRGAAASELPERYRDQLADWTRPSLGARPT